MSSRYCIDSSAWLEYFKGTIKGAQVKAIIEKENEIMTSILAVAEIADKYEKESMSHKQVLSYVKGRAALLPITIAIAVHAAQIKKHMRKQNTKFGLADALHLATAAEEDAILVTTDHDFQGVENVMVIA